MMFSSTLPRVRLTVAGVILALGLAGLCARAADTNDSPRQRLLMDFGWKFHLGDDWGVAERLDKAGQSAGPARPAFNDSAWRSVNLPHDWAVELPYDEKASPNSGFKPVGPGFTNNSVGWYRRSFRLPAEDRDKRLWLEFDGAFRDSRIFLNGYLIAHHEGGYGSVRYDITDVANCGGANLLAVRVDASQSEGWFYEGAGIYRHVWLVVTAPLALAGDGTFVYSQFSNNVPGGPATLQIETQVRNSQTKSVDTALRCLILDPDGREAAKSGQTVSFDPLSLKTVFQSVQVAAPVLWSPEKPRLYKLVATMIAGGAVVDRTETEFGIRTIAFDAAKGFLLNGAPYVIKGTCDHQDHAGVGAALPDALQYFRVARLKEMGANAIRTSHNPPTAELLEACDHLGMLVMDENRLLGSDSRNLGRLERLVCRDRNHPSVFIWSLANEETAQRTDTAGRIAATMQRLVRQLDPTRPCTAAMSSWSAGAADGISLGVDVQGFNYGFHYPQSGSVDRFHAANPNMPAIGTEVASAFYTRGIYEITPPYHTAYDTNKPAYGATAEEWWNYYAVRPWASGGFVWTGFDHRGPLPFLWPSVLSPFGILDSCGFPKDVFYYYQSWWSDKVVLHLMPHWNWAGMEGREMDVWCFSNCEEVELFLNGDSLGRKQMPKNSHLQWMVKYAPGTLLARGYKAGRQIAQEQVETTGAPAALRLSPDRAALRADGKDAGVIAVSIIDSKGRVVPVAGNLVHFELAGPGAILGVGNGDPASHEPDVFLAAAGTPSSPDWQRHAFNGLAQVIVQSGKVPGRIQLTARSEGLAPATLEIAAQPCAPRPAAP
jgi:beta-galactosidase